MGTTSRVPAGVGGTARLRTQPCQPTQAEGVLWGRTWLWTGDMQVSPPAVKLQKASRASRGLPWLGSM